MTAGGMHPGSLAAIILAGGRGSRLGGRYKPALYLDGATLLDRVRSAAAAAGASPIVVVGPEVGGGPVAAIAAGLERLSGVEAVLLLAGDLARPERAVGLLVESGSAADGSILVDPDGREQWLAGRYRAGALRASLTSLGEPVDASMRTLLGRLALERIPAPAATVADIDTWEDYERARVEAEPPAAAPR